MGGCPVRPALCRRVGPLYPRDENVSLLQNVYPAERHPLRPVLRRPLLGPQEDPMMRALWGLLAVLTLVTPVGAGVAVLDWDYPAAYQSGTTYTLHIVTLQ